MMSVDCTFCEMLFDTVCIFPPNKCFSFQETPFLIMMGSRIKVNNKIVQFGCFLWSCGTGLLSSIINIRCIIFGHNYGVDRSSWTGLWT
jgi:hypothetical protein